MGKYGELVIAKSCTNLKKPQNTQQGHWVRDITINENIIVIQSTCIEQTSPTLTLTLIKITLLWSLTMRDSGSPLGYYHCLVLLTLS